MCYDKDMSFSRYNNCGPCDFIELYILEWVMKGFGIHSVDTRTFY